VLLYVHIYQLWYSLKSKAR